MAERVVAKHSAPAALPALRRPLTGALPRLTPASLLSARRFSLRCAHEIDPCSGTAEGACSADSRISSKASSRCSSPAIEKRNPEALLELEQENLRKQIANFNQGLATHAGLCERIMGQVRKLEAEQKDLRAKTAAHLRAGNKSAAGQYALRLQTVEAQLEENRKQLEQAEATYKNLVKARDVAVQTARAKIEGLKGAINDMRMNQAMAEIHEMASGMISSIGGAGDTLNRLHEMVEEERTKAAGRARIAQGLDRHDAASRSRRPS